MFLKNLGINIDHSKGLFALISLILISVGCTREQHYSASEPSYDIHEFNIYSGKILPDSLYPVINKIRAESLSKKDYQTYTRGSNLIINSYMLAGDYEKGFFYANSFLDEVLAAGDSTDIPDAYYNLGKLYYGLGLSEISLDYFLQVAQYNLPDDKRSGVFYAIAEASRNSKLEEGLDSKEYYKKSENLARSLNDSIRIAGALFGQSQIYFRSLDIYELEGIGLRNGLRDSLETSIRLLEEALLYDPASYIINVALGLNYTAGNESEKGIEYAQKGYDIMLTIPDLVPMAKNVMASINSYKGNYTDAIRFAEESYAFANEFNKKGDMRNSMKILYHTYKHAGDNAKALKAYENYIKTQDELSDAERQMGLVFLQVKYDTQLKEERLADAETSNQFYQVAILIIASLLILVSFLLIFSYQTFMKKQFAYRKLVDGMEKWANNERNEIASITEEDKLLLKQAHRLMVETKLYKNPTLTLDSLADELSVNRNTLSKAINSVTNKNFNNFINDYRVKEAIRLMSSSQKTDYSIDELLDQIGFNSRTTFYVAFKKVTGLSPTEYKNNKKID